MREGWSAIFVCGVTVLLLAAAPAHGAFPGRPGPIAYSKVSAGEAAEGVEEGGGIFSHGPRRSDTPRQLTDSTEDSSPAYSPNGRLVVFTGNRNPGLGARGRYIYVMNRDGSDIRQLTSGEFADFNPSFAPDGRHVIFDRSELALGQRSHIFSVAIDGSGLRQVSSGAASDQDPVYTPNGRRIVFVSDRRRSGRRDHSNIFSMRPDGSRVRLLIGGPRSEFDPDVSPNGRKIVFVSSRNHGPNLFVARANGRRVHALTRSRGDCFRGTCYSNPTWSPDGKHIAFLGSGRYKTVLEVMRADGRGFARDFDSGGTEEEGFGTTLGPPSWGPQPR